VKFFRSESSDSSELKDSKSVFLQFTSADLPGEVKIGYLIFRVKQYVLRPLRCFNVTAMGMSLAIAEGNCGAQFAVANISIACAALLLQNVPTVESATPRMIKSARDTNGKLKSLNYKQRQNCPMLMPVKNIELPEVLPFRIWFHNSLFPLF